MSSAPELRLQTWDAGEHAPAATPLRFSGAIATADVRCLPGASALHVAVSNGDGVRLRAEVSAEPDEVVPLRFELEDGGVLQLSSHGRSILHLPADVRYEPLAPIRPAAAPAPLDVAIVVDGTTRFWPEAEAAATRLLDQKERWSEHVEKLVRFVDRIGEGRNCRATVIAFGDQEPPAVTARDLQPHYLLFPDEDNRVFQRFDAERLRDLLINLPSSPGADFVDATADALDACAHLSWRKDSRRLVIVTGDSPGASLLHPLPKGADLCVRRFDVDTRALELHRNGVEVLTIYHPPPSALLALRSELLASTREQYERLASLRELAFTSASFDPESAASRFGERSSAIARGAALGELVRAAASSRRPQ
jgi:hypothetical protein